MNNESSLIIYNDENGQTQVNVKLKDETVWLTQDAMVKLFESSKANISEHITHIYQEGELEKKSTVRKFRTVQKEGNRQVSRELEYYNLDLILSVGYRIKSKTATRFRIWATKTLKEYIIQGYAINKERLKEKQEQLETLKNTLNIIERSFKEEVKNLETAQTLNWIVKNFASGLNLLDDFDHKELDKKGKTEKDAVIITPDEFLNVINDMKQGFNSDVFALKKDDSFDSSVNQIYQSFGGADCYPSIEEKAAMLLYLIVKNHSFIDGNKRIAASCFLYFLDKNGILYKNNIPIIDNAALFALTLLTAQSNPKEMQTIKDIIMSVLNRNEKEIYD